MTTKSQQTTGGRTIIFGIPTINIASCRSLSTRTRRTGTRQRIQRSVDIKHSKSVRLNICRYLESRKRGHYPLRSDNECRFRPMATSAVESDFFSFCRRAAAYQLETIQKRVSGRGKHSERTDSRPSAERFNY